MISPYDNNIYISGKLNRTIPLWLITLYGIGTILGAGIYVLIADISSLSGGFTPVSFLISAVIVSFSALSYSELSARYPASAGEAVYVQKAFSKKWLSIITGWSIVFTGIVSSATIARGFVGYFQVFYEVPFWQCISALVLFLCIVSIWGVGISLKIAALMTIIEVFGIILVIYLGAGNLTALKDDFYMFVPPADIAIWSNIFVGAFIAFYAYVGFEDIVNMAEEVKNPVKNLPVAIVSALIITTLLYIIVSLVTITTLPVDVLKSTRSPFTSIVEQTGRFPVSGITVISILAVVNGALIQIIMSSRVLYGMATQKISLQFFGYVNKRTKTPVIATVFVSSLVLVMALRFPLIMLAKITSFIILTVFITVNLSLLLIKLKKEQGEPGGVRFPIFVPITGFILCLLMILVQALIEFRG